MARDPRYDLLFQPMQIGPVIAPNRFFQVPHCTGMGWQRPHTLAAMRGVKAEGGWGVVCTEYNSIHPSSDDLPHPSAALWDDSDIAAHRLMTDAVHQHGALAGAELWYGGQRTANLFTREVPLDLGSYPNGSGHPFQTRAMDRADIRTFRRWHRDAAIRAKKAEFDIVYVYATHGYLLSNFLNPRMNDRGDEYGGSLENRVRLVRELIEETKEAVGDRCAVAVRFAADETIGEDSKPQLGERHEMFEMLAELPDLWDINITDYSLEMGVSRFVPEAPLEPYMNWVKAKTTKPVVTVGRYTSPDAMAALLKNGVADFVGAARPSIADPFLPAKIRDGKIDHIRECIGCNICYSGDSLGVPIRCTQNPAMGEEWRKGWHPEHLPAATKPESVLIVGAGPTGLEAARALGARGYNVMLAEATRTLGGRVTREASLPGMAAYARVRNYRENELAAMENVEIFRESQLSADDIFDIAPDHVLIATGAKWQRTRFDEERYIDIASNDSAIILTPDDIMAGKMPPNGPVIIYDEDGYYMGGVLAEKIRQAGHEVLFVTPDDSVSSWAEMTSERWRIRTHLLKLGIKIITAHSLENFDGATATLSCAYSEAQTDHPANSIVMVTQRQPDDALYQELRRRADAQPEAQTFTLARAGDCEAPAIIAAAIYAGHRYGRELGVDNPKSLYERPDVSAHYPELAPVTPNQPAPDPAYLATLAQYIEEEIEGEAYYRAMAARLTNPVEQEKMMLLANIEAHTASATMPLALKYGLPLKPSDALTASGKGAAMQDSADWQDALHDMRKSFPKYIDDFRALEAMAPPEDLPRLKLMTQHEVAALEFAHAETEGNADSERPLLAFLGQL